jgi:hypothetical protein
MKVFLSWSGEKSQKVALALRDWLPCVLQGVEPFVSSQDIYAGGRWQQEIARHLEASRFGVVCVTRANQDSAWLNFEAGALAKVVDVSRVVPLAVDLNPADVKQPLGQFQAKSASETGVAELITSLNDAFEASLPQDVVTRSFEKWWPELSALLVEIDQANVVASPPPAERTDRELLEEVLNTVRGNRREPARVFKDFLPEVLFDHVQSYSITGSDDLVISTPTPLPQSVRDLITRRAEAESLGVSFAIGARPSREAKNS